MRYTFIVLAMAAMLNCTPAFSQEIIIWHDEQGKPHAAGTEEDIPPVHRPQAHGVLTTLDPAMASLAMDDGWALAQKPDVYRDGLGLFQPIRFELDMEQTTGYVFLGTKYNLVKASAAVAARKFASVPWTHVARVNTLDSLPIAFYSWRFKPVLMLLIQEGKIIKGEEGFEKEIDPGIKIPAHVKSFPYEAIDFAKPVQVQLYSREGNLVQLNINLPEYR